MDPHDVLDRLDAAIDDAASLPLSCLSRDDVGAWLCRLQHVRARVDAMLCSATVAAEQASVCALDGLRTVAAYVGAHTSVDPAVVSADRRLGLWLHGFPTFDEAFGAGRLQRRHVMALRELDSPRTHASLRDAQQYLVNAAAHCDWTGFRRVLGYWAIAADPDGEEPLAQAARRSCNVAVLADGMVSGRFLLDPLSGAAVRAALTQAEQRLFRAEAGRADDRTDGDGDGDGDGERGAVTFGRSDAARRRADALVELITTGASAARTAAAPPLVHLVMSERVAEHLLESIDDPHGSDAALPVDPFDVDRRCELVDGTAVHPRAAMGAMAAAALRRLVLSADGEILDLGRRTRLFPPNLKQAMLVAARGHCAVRGCDAPLGWLEADHLIPAARGGPTATANGQILCEPHNKAKRDHPPPDPCPVPARAAAPPGRNSPGQNRSGQNRSGQNSSMSPR